MNPELTSNLLKYLKLTFRNEKWSFRSPDDHIINVYFDSILWIRVDLKLESISFIKNSSDLDDLKMAVDILEEITEFLNYEP